MQFQELCQVTGLPLLWETQGTAMAAESVFGVLLRSSLKAVFTWYYLVNYLESGMSPFFVYFFLFASATLQMTNDDCLNLALE